MGTHITSSSLTLLKVIINENTFFSILPKEWQELIIPAWKEHQNSSKIYGLFLNNILVGGGILFDTLPPFATKIEKNNIHLFNKGYLYLGYVYISERYRNKGYASIFLTQLKTQHRKLWLTVEEAALLYFYKQNGFKIYTEDTSLTNTKEWILTYE